MKNKFYGDLESLIYFISVLAVTFIVATLVSRFLNRMVRRSVHKMGTDLTNYYFLKHFIVGIIYLVGIGWAFLMLPAFKTVAHTLLTGAGIVAIIAGLASQQVLSNITSGLFMVIFKPFRINDRITIRDTLTGNVEDMTLRHTVIRDLNNNRIIVPNSVMGNEIIVNTHIGESKVCQKVDIGIGYGSDIDRALSIIREEVAAHKDALHADSDLPLHGDTAAVTSQVVSLDDSAVVLRFWMWATDASTAFRMQGDLLKSIKERFGRAGIEIPFPQRTVWLANSSKTNSDKKTVQP